jgi:ubiquinol oxidase
MCISTHCIEDIENGLVPGWENQPAPRIAIVSHIPSHCGRYVVLSAIQDYWRLPNTATLLDVIRAVRADEATHRFVNHSLADLDHKKDFNPFALGEASAELRGTKAG